MFQLGIFDDNKGRKEGTESEKIVAWYPVTTEVDYQVRSIGLLQGLLQFLSIFESVRSIDTIVRYSGSTIEPI